ncbi:hypothetical protein [Mariniluteicoccus flavus]
MTFLEIDPNSVVAGWIPLVLTIVLGIVVFLLFRSMRTQLRRIDIPDEGIDTRAEQGDRTERPKADTQA